jgi:hypothetical protein
MKPAIAWGGRERYASVAAPQRVPGKGGENVDLERPGDQHEVHQIEPPLTSPRRRGCNRIGGHTSRNAHLV